MSEYKHPEVLVTTDWVAQNLNAPNTRLVEVDIETTAYDHGHIPGAVSSVDEFPGKIIAPPGMTETAQRAGHIPNAANIPWAQASNEDGTFKSADALAALYQGKGVTGGEEVIAYCRIGERSSHTWFV